MSTPPELTKACATCGRYLDWLIPADGSEPRWRHGLADGGDLSDHPPVPVDETEIIPLGRCDFCQADEVVAILPVHAFRTPGITGSTTDYGSADDWSACTGCARLIGLNQWTALLRRVKKHWEQRHSMPMPRDVEAGVARLYREVRRNQRGGLRPFVRPHPAPPGPAAQDGQRRVRGVENL